MKNKKTILIILITVLCFFLGGMISYLVFGSDNSKNDTKNDDQTIVESQNVTGASIEQDVLKAATELLQESLNTAGADPKEALEKLDNNDFSFISDDLKNKILFTGDFADDEKLQANTYQSLITVSMLSNSINNAGGVITPIATPDSSVTYIENTNVAHVTLTSFAGPTALFSLEFAFIDDEWVFVPYTLIDSVKLSAILQNTIE